MTDEYMRTLQGQILAVYARAGRLEGALETIANMGCYGPVRSPRNESCGCAVHLARRALDKEPGSMHGTEPDCTCIGAQSIMHCPVHAPGPMRPIEPAAKKCTCDRGAEYMGAHEWPCTCKPTRPTDTGED